MDGISSSARSCGASREPRSGARDDRADAPHDHVHRGAHPDGVARSGRGRRRDPDGDASERSERELRGEGAGGGRRPRGRRADDGGARRRLHARIVRRARARRSLMDVVTLLLAQTAAFGLVVSRLAGFVVASPFPGNHVGTTQRVGLVVVLAWVTSLFAPTNAVPAEIGARLMMACALEVGCGVAMGFAFHLVFSAAEVLGQMLAQSTGLGTAAVLNPAIDAQDSPLGRIVSLLAMLLALGAAVHRTALAYLLGPFRAIPVGS